MPQAPMTCAIITPERQVIDAEVTSVILPAHDGQIGILWNRAPLLCELGIGILTIETREAGPKEFFVDGGFAQVLENDVSVLTEQAAAAEDLDRSSVEKALEEARKMPMGDTASIEARNAAVARAKAQIKIAKE